MKERQQFGGVFGDLTCNALVRLKSDEDELLDVLDDLGLPQIVDADPSKSWEVTSDGSGLAGCEDGKQPTGKEVNMSGEDFRDGLTWFSGRSCTARDEIEVEPVYEEDHNLVLHFALQQREEDDSFEHFVRIADSFPEPGGVFLLDEAFDGPRLAELGVDGVEEVDEVCVGGGGGVPGQAQVFMLMKIRKLKPGRAHAFVLKKIKI